MKPRQLLLGGGLVAITALTAWVAGWPPFATHLADTEERPRPASEQISNEASQEPTPEPEPQAPLSDAQMRILEDPGVIEFSRHLEFQQSVREFFDQADALDKNELRDRAQTLQGQLDSYEADGRVSASEALVLRLAMVKTLETDPERQNEASVALIREYQQEANARLEEWKEQPRPEFESYKQREQAIVNEVMAMESIPGNLSRNEYLRQRLHQARVDTMGDGAEGRQP